MHDYDNKDDWYDDLVAIAGRHHNKSAVRDREGWTMNWQAETPAQAYYGEYPEHKPESAPAHGCGHMQGRGAA
ncbi:MAG: hypothetical protein KKC18_07875 [Chloroflexi bacterium]|nr:hypothetical protein [Chloroflexota bacterium]